MDIVVWTLAGGWLVAPALGLTEAGELNVVGLVVALVCAVVGLSVVNDHREDALRVLAANSAPLLLGGLRRGR